VLCPKACKQLNRRAADAIRPNALEILLHDIFIEPFFRTGFIENELR
jgi:hypothetical protein